MQRHKEPLEFVESPYVGTRHYRSPVLAAQRPCLTSSISTELLREKWVSPQFSHENGNPVEVKKRRRAACKNARTQKKKQIVQIKENLFPSLDFPSQSNGKIAHSNKQPEDNFHVQRSTRTNPTPLLNDITENDHQQTHDIKTHENKFLFRLGSPKPSTVSSEILVHETPENEMFESYILRKRLRNVNFNYIS